MNSPLTCKVFSGTLCTRSAGHPPLCFELRSLKEMVPSELPKGSSLEPVQTSTLFGLLSITSISACVLLLPSLPTVLLISFFFYLLELNIWFPQICSFCFREDSMPFGSSTWVQIPVKLFAKCLTLNIFLTFLWLCLIIRKMWMVVEAIPQQLCENKLKYRMSTPEHSLLATCDHQACHHHHYLKPEILLQMSLWLQAHEFWNMTF